MHGPPAGPVPRLPRLYARRPPQGWSWSLSFTCACRYARHYDRDVADRIADRTDPHAAARYAGYRSQVVTGLVDKQDVVGVLEFDLGHEIVVDPARVRNVQRIPHRSPARDTPELPAAGELTRSGGRW